MSILFELRERSGGFFNQIWFLLGNYLISKRYGLEFIVNDKKWMFANKNGWTDYFESNINLNTSTLESVIISDGDPILNTFTLQEYRDACSTILNLNNNMIELLDKTLNKYKLVKGEYDTIMIRRGDKMYGESKYINTEKYVLPLLDKNTTTIFVQTDDYNAYNEVCDIINKYNKNIKVITTCPPTKFGAFGFNYCPEIGSSLTPENDNYLKNLLTLPKNKPICNYTSTEMKEHVEEMLVGMHICLLSRYLVTEFQSNATRFLFVNHTNPQNVITIDNTPIQSFNTHVKCPVFGFY